jgi:hypothetical protein
MDRPGVEGIHFILMLPACRDHDDWDTAPLADPADHFDAIQIGKTEIEKEEIRLTRRYFRESVFSRFRAEQTTTLGFEDHLQPVADLRIVLGKNNREDTPGSSFMSHFRQNAGVSTTRAV